MYQWVLPGPWACLKQNSSRVCRRSALLKLHDSWIQSDQAWATLAHRLIIPPGEPAAHDTWRSESMSAQRQPDVWLRQAQLQSCSQTDKQPTLAAALLAALQP